MRYSNSECEELGGCDEKGACNDVVAVATEAVPGKISGVTLIYTSVTQEEAQLQIACTTTDKLPGPMLDISSPQAGKQYFSHWATRCHDPPVVMDSSAWAKIDLNKVHTAICRYAGAVRTW